MTTKRLPLVGRLIYDTPWAIRPEMLIEIDRIYERHIAGEPVDIPAIEAQIGRPLGGDDDDAPYQMADGGVAVIPITGVIAKRLDLFTQISGGACVESIAAAFKTALQDNAVRSILFKVDSPGGTIEGIFELADAIYEARNAKPIGAVAYGMMASAAYLIGSAASQIYASDVASAVGSIGIVAVHKDRSAQNKLSGVKTTEIYKGKYKHAIGEGPLSAEGQALIEDRVNTYYGLFIDAVAKYRGVSSDAVLKNMSTDVKDVFIGQQAVDAGLIDGIQSYDGVLSTFADLAAPGSAPYMPALRRAKPQGAAESEVVAEIQKEEGSMEKVICQGNRPANSSGCPDGCSGCEGCHKDASAKASARAKEIFNAQVKENERFFGLVGLLFGEEATAKLKAVVDTGTTPDQLKAIIGVTGNAQAKESVKGKEQQTKEALLTGIIAAGAQNVGAGGDANADKDYMTLVSEYRAAKKCNLLAAMQAMTAAYPEKHDAYLKAANAGRGGV
jgi:signal peptide peptidase SppA